MDLVHCGFLTLSDDEVHESSVGWCAHGGGAEVFGLKAQGHHSLYSLPAVNLSGDTEGNVLFRNLILLLDFFFKKCQ